MEYLSKIKIKQIFCLTVTESEINHAKSLTQAEIISKIPIVLGSSLAGDGSAGRSIKTFYVLPAAYAAGSNPLDLAAHDPSLPTVTP